MSSFVSGYDFIGFTSQMTPESWSDTPLLNIKLMGPTTSFNDKNGIECEWWLMTNHSFGMEKPASRSLLNVTVLLATWPPRPPIQVIHFLGPEQSLPIASASKVHVWRMLHNSLINLVTTMSFIPFLVHNVHCPWVGGYNADIWPVRNSTASRLQHDARRVTEPRACRQMPQHRSPFCADLGSCRDSSAPPSQLTLLFHAGELPCVRWASNLVLCAWETRWSPRTRMLARMLMVQMSKHISHDCFGSELSQGFGTHFSHSGCSDTAWIFFLRKVLILWGDKT